MKLIVRLAALGAAALLATSAGPASAPSRSADAPFWSATPSPAEFVRAQDARLDRARAAIAHMTGATRARTIANTLRPYDDAVIELQMAGSQAGLIEEVHPDSAMRATAEAVSRAVSAYQTEISLNRAIYDALVALDVRKADPATQHYVQRLLRDFRLAGVDRDAATRAKITELRKQIVETGQDFGRNIRTDVRKVTVASIAELDGLPADYIARHKPAADGTITITTDNPDARPVFDYANNPEDSYRGDRATACRSAAHQREPALRADPREARRMGARWRPVRLRERVRHTLPGAATRPTTSAIASPLTRPPVGNPPNRSVDCAT